MQGFLSFPPLSRLNEVFYLTPQKEEFMLSSVLGCYSSFLIYAELLGCFAHAEVRSMV